jgi:hypothetical protein
MEERRHYRGGLVWPVILIGAGVVFLLNNLNLLSWGVWDTLFRLWPVLLIAIGLDILIGRRSIWGSVAVAILLLAALGAAVWLGRSGLEVPSWTGAEVATTETINQPLEGATAGDVEIGFGTGSLRITALPEGAGLIEGKVDLSQDERVSRDFRKSGETAYFVLRSNNARFHMMRDTWPSDKVWDLGLSRDVPLRLKISAGVGRVTIDLTQLDVTDFELEGGVGQATLTLPRRGRLEAKVEGGVGEVTVLIPQGMAARIRVDGGLGGVNVSDTYDRRDDEYTSPGYNSAVDRVDLRIDGGVGRITVREVVEE